MTVETGLLPDPFNLHIKAAMAENERKKISERTVAALAALMRQGVKLGTPSRRSLKAASKKGVAVRQAAAKAFADGMLTMVRGYQAGGMSLRGIAEELNTRGVPTYRGNGTWTAKQPWRMQRIVAAPAVM